MIWHDMIWYKIIWYDMMLTTFLLQWLLWISYDDDDDGDDDDDDDCSMKRVYYELDFTWFILFFFIPFGFPWLGCIPFVLLVLSFLQWHSLSLHHIISDQII